MQCPTIMAILVDQRNDAAAKVQNILTKYGYAIKTRLGIHDGDAEEGLIILQLCGSSDDVMRLEQALSQIHRVKVQKMVLELPDEGSCQC